ncbi:MAG: response regulator transcription factor [Actinobacteria bacterium]|jgi:DNA-binding NarL/FixJ family response regulator|uniref:DNA-binding NarL/FixJ family response regulator n=1 Tax=Nocardioides marinus TaxID=374514 RepID=A0A7Y9YCM4_9ACTN|nr:response regulator transcription factor [Nocardioides marinus]MBU2075778.1 response regulator transcription factor [Actinomycetota bacterium]MBU2110100.1 response regulator transcription factor [Actinomycetota bacterium]NYI09738.1 DNA-binding NarL/FixJ family response regulator [Nocardioides marinus]
MPLRPSRPVRLGVVAETELVAHGLAGMLRPHSGRVSLSVLREPGPTAGLDVVLCDPFDGRDVSRGLEQIPALGPAKVLVFTWSDHPQRRRRALEAGADGFLTKRASAAELLATVEAVLRGDPVPEHGPRGEEPPAFPGLSQRESEVLVLIGRGLSNQEIADRIYVSVNSVKTYIRQIYAKTGATRRTQAVAWAHDHGWGG